MNIQDFLKDFRLLKNCINEFFIYQNEIDGIKNKSLLFQYESFKRNNKTINIDELIDEKTFSLILYKNLYPKDFSKLEKKEGILFKCLKEINNILDIKENNRTNKSIKEILKKHDNDETRKKFKTRIEILNNEFNYNETERVDSLLLYTLLIKGYIEDDFEMLIKKNNEAILSYPEQEFLFNVKNDIPASQFLYLREENLHYICIQIIDYQWNSPGILNNIIIDYILKGTEPDSNTKASKIVEAMYNFDSYRKTYDKFIPQYFEHCSKENINTYPLLNAIEDVLSELSSTTDTEEYDFEDTAIHGSAHFLNTIFKEINILYFKNFLDSIYYDYTNSNQDESPTIDYNAISAINFFLDKKDNELFKETLFDKADKKDLSRYEKSDISINLTIKILKKIINYKKLNSSIYNINKENIDLILKEFNISTEESYYLTHCLQVNDLNDRVLNEPYNFFLFILSDFNIVEEDYSSLKAFFDANNRLKYNINESSIKNYLKKISPKWEKFVIYNRYTSFDDYLSKNIKEFMLSDNLNQQISNNLKNDETGIKEFVRAVIKKSNIDNNILLQYFLPFWGKYVSILNCYEGEEQEIQIMVPERNHLLQKYTIDNTRNRPSQIMIDLMIKEPDYFIKNYPEEEYAKDSEFRLLVLDSKAENIDNIKRLFFEKIDICPSSSEDYRRYRIYKNTGTHLRKDFQQKYAFIYNILNGIHNAFNRIKDINPISYNPSSLEFAIQYSKQLDNTQYTIDDLWLKLLLKTLKYWFQKFCTFADQNMVPSNIQIYSGTMIQLENEEKINKIRQEIQNDIPNIKFWVKELEEYAKSLGINFFS